MNWCLCMDKSVKNTEQWNICCKSCRQSANLCRMSHMPKSEIIYAMMINFVWRDKLLKAFVWRTRSHSQDDSHHLFLKLTQSTYLANLFRPLFLHPTRQLEPMSSTNFNAKMHSHWILKVTWLFLTNQTALFQYSVDKQWFNLFRTLSPGYHIE